MRNNVLKFFLRDLRQKSVNSYKMESCNGNSLKNAPRERLGLWGSGGETDVPGSVSGLQRLQHKKYNKVSVRYGVEMCNVMSFIMTSQCQSERLLSVGHGRLRTAVLHL